LQCLGGNGHLKNNTPIPYDLMNKVSTRVRHLLIREKIVTCEQIIELHEKRLFNIKGVGRTTVFDIQRLQKKIIQRHPHLTKSCEKANCEKSRDVVRLAFTDAHTNGCPLKNLGSSNAVESCLLTCTLPAVFQVQFPNYNYAYEDTQITISNLGIPLDDLNRLRTIALFPNDSADCLFHVTVGYLLNAEISEEALSIILIHLAHVSGFIDKSQMILSTEFVPDVAIFNDIPASVFAELSISQSPIVNTINNEVITAICENIGALSERDIILRLGFSIEGLKVLRQLWCFREQAIELMKKYLKGVPVEAYRDYDRLIDEFLLPLVKHERESRILKGRLGLLDGQKWTLEELGSRENITRERVRQIEEKYITKIQKPKAIERLAMLWHTVTNILSAGGGVCRVQEINETLGKRWRWQNNPPDTALANLIGLSPEYDVIWGDPILIVMPKHKCVTCQKIRSEIVTIIGDQADGILYLSIATAKMMEFCKRKTYCNNISSIVEFSNGYLNYLDNVIEEINVDDSALYTSNAWTMKYGKKRTLLVEAVLRNSGRPMHFTEVCAEINKDRPEHDKISERNVYARIDFSKELLLWDRGTFIHRDNVSIPFDVITNIEDDIICRLDGKIPYLSVSGIFKQYEEILLKNNIPSESALYSCLRESNNTNLRCPEYPYIMKSDAIEPRQPVQLVVEKFILENENIIEYEQIRNYAVQQLCINEALFTAAYFPKIPNIFRVDRGKYIHMQQIGIQKKNLDSIIQHLTTHLSSSRHVSVIRLFKEKLITCKQLGIVSPMLLFSILQFFYSDRYDLSRYPRINLSGALEESGHATGVASEIISFILRKKAPCSYPELLKHFVDDLGYEQNSVYYAIYSYKDILHYSASVVVHFENLGWTDGKQKILELVAANYINDRENANKPFGLISHFHDYYFNQLPALPDNICWTPTLLGELLCRKEKYKIIGSQRNAFVAIPNLYRIETLDDLLYYILNADYYGAANLNVFVCDMREAGILKQKLTPMMLGSESRVVINGNVVKLAGINDNVK